MPRGAKEGAHLMYHDVHVILSRKKYVAADGTVVVGSKAKYAGISKDSSTRMN